MLLIGIVVLIAYIPAIFGDYVWDDASLPNNPQINAAGGLWDIWLNPSANHHEGHYWPLVYSTFWLEAQIWGLHPASLHLVNLLFHLFNATLFWILLARLGAPGAGLAALVFALHPIHVESAGWIIERKDVMSGMFYLLTALAFLRWERKKDWNAYRFALVLFVCAMLSKSIVVTLPVALGLWVWMSRPPEMARRDGFWLTPFLFLAAVISIADLIYLKGREEMEATGLSWFERILIAGRGLWFYAHKLIWPSNLMAIYPRWSVGGDPALFLIFLFGVGLVLVCRLGFRRRLRTLASFSVLYFAVTLLPVLGFLDFGAMDFSFVADRFQYLAGMGLIALFAGLATRVVRRLNMEESIWSRTGICATALALGAMTWDQAGHYHDTETLFLHNVSKNPEAWMAEYNLGVVQSEQGKINEAISHYTRSLQLKSNRAQTHNNLGNCLLKLERLDEAVAQLKEAVRLQPKWAEAHYNLGLAEEHKEATSEAIQEFEKALQNRSNFLEAYLHLAALWEKSGPRGKADQYITPDLKARFDSAESEFAAGHALAGKGETDAAVGHYVEALRLKPNYAEVHNNLAVVLAGQGKTDEALEHLNQAIKFKADYAEAYNNIGVIFGQQKKWKEAAENFAKALQIDPGYEDARKNLEKAQRRLQSPPAPTPQPSTEKGKNPPSSTSP